MSSNRYDNKRKRESSEYNHAKARVRTRPSLLENVRNILEEAYDISRPPLPLENIYEQLFAVYPFNQRKELQTPGNVISYLWRQLKNTKKFLHQREIDVKTLGRNILILTIDSLFKLEEEASSKELAIIFYNIGELYLQDAREILLYDQDRLPNLRGSFILKKLLYILLSKNPNGQDIANTLYAMSKLINIKLLFKELNSEVIGGLVKALSHKENLKDQDIANTIYSLGIFAKAHHPEFLANVDPQHIQILIQMLLYISQPHAQGIANIASALGELAAAHQRWLLMKISPNDISSLVHKLPSARPSAQNIANIIDALAKIAQPDLKNQIDLRPLLININPRAIKDLVHALITTNPTSQNIANTLHALSMLAKTGQGWLLEEIVVDDIYLLVSALPVVDPKPKDLEISSAVHALGELAKTGYIWLLKTISPKNISSLVHALPATNPDAQAIANTIYGLGELAKTNLGSLLSKIDPRAIKDLIYALPSKHFNEQDISNTVYAIGELAKLGHKSLLSEILPHDISFLVSVLPGLRASTQSISMTTYALAELAKADYTGLLKIVSPENISSLVHALPNSHPEAQHIANTLYAVGELAKANVGSLLGGINPRAIKGLIDALTITRPLHSQDIATTLHALGVLAKTGQGWLLAEIHPDDICLLISALPVTDPKPKDLDISSAVHALGEFAKTGYTWLLKTVSPENVSALVHALPAANPDAQAVANTIYGLNELAKANLGSLLSKINPQAIKDLVNILLKAYPTAQEIANTIYSIGELATSGWTKLLEQVVPEDIGLLVQLLINRLLLDNFLDSAQNIFMAIYGLGILARANYGHLLIKVSPTHINSLIDTLLSTNPTASHIAITLYGLSELAKIELGFHLSLAIDQETISKLACDIWSKEPSPQNISNIAITFLYLSYSPAVAAEFFNHLKELNVATWECIDLMSLHQFCGTILAKKEHTKEFLFEVKRFYEETKDIITKNWLPPNSSGSHQTYFALLQNKFNQFTQKYPGMDFQLENEIYCYGFFVDIVITKNKKPWVAIEINGSYHLLFDGTYNFPHRQREKILEVDYSFVWNHKVGEKIEDDIEKLLDTLKDKIEENQKLMNRINSPHSEVTYTEHTIRCTLLAPVPSQHTSISIENNEIPESASYVWK
ncbi:MAG TPA: hypothetical protein VHZ76_08720 [Gammaproteobacteria bacterium]|nr:hypothetical protein [Gammaproteobacteria bacterium]